MSFPADWPQGCPPDDVEDAHGEVFRVVKTDPPTAADFLSYHEMGITRGDPIRRCGLSVSRVRADAEHASRAFPNLGDVIARAVLTPEHGKVKQTGRPSHTTWWPAEGVDRAGLFTVAGVVT